MNRKPKTDEGKSRGGGGDDEAVDSLLRAAEDELLLNLSLNSHMSRGISHSSNSYIHPDLDHRFQSLKTSRPTPTSTKNIPTPASSSPAVAADDDLLARFAALKGDSVSLPSSSSFQSNRLDERSDHGKILSSDGVDEDEVQKLIQWAVDAARLDPSPPIDSDDDSFNDDGYSDDSDEGFSDHGGSEDCQSKGRRKKGQKGK